MLLLSDGTVMAHNLDTSNWFRLAPDANGDYVNGTWTNMASMHDTRVWYTSQVLRDGRVLVAGGENGSGFGTAEVYDPLDNTWTYTLPARVGFSDCGSMMLPDGRVLVSPVVVSNYPIFSTVIFDPGSNSWAQGPANTNSQNEASWVKLPDDSILTIDINSSSTERYIPSLNKWTPDAPAPLIWNLVNSEIGPGLLLPNGKALFIGGNGSTAIYTPSGSTIQGTWTSGANLPPGLTAQDAPGAMMVNGKILCALGPNFGVGPTSFYEYDYLANTFTPAGGPADTATNFATFLLYMLDLPDGSVLCSFYQTNNLYVYRPFGAPIPAGKPTISGISQNSDGSYHLTGTLFNGISAGAAYGDDGQMDSNYPLVRLTNNATHAVYYARTFNWSSTGVQTGGNPVSTEFTIPQPVLNGGPVSYSLVAVANGIASDPITFFGPVWVDFNYVGVTQNGSFTFPYKTLTNGISNVPVNGTILCKGPASHRETPRITKAMHILASPGPVTVGR